MSEERDNVENGIEQRGIDRRTALKGGAVGLGLAGLSAIGASPAAAGNGADKMYVGGSTLEVMEVSTTDTENHSDTHTLLTGYIKTSSPTDLVFQPTAETALFTSISVDGTGDETSRAAAGVTCWIELDGEPVVVTNDHADWMTQQDAAEVVFDRREYSMSIVDWDDEEQQMEQFISTRSANGFNWIDLDVGSDTHTVELKGRLDVYVNDPSAEAKAMVGPRTLLANPVKLSNDAQI